MLGNLFNKNNRRNQNNNNNRNDFNEANNNYSISVTSAKNNFISDNDFASTSSKVFQNFNNYSSNNHHLKPTTVVAKSATGAFLGSNLDDISYSQQKKYFHHSHHITNPPILDHICDDLKYCLFGTKNVLYSNTTDTTQMATIRDKNYAFRILIAEETGQIACRNNYKVSLDYSVPRGSDIEKIRPNELKQYTFGSMVRTNDSLKDNEKFRVIPNSEFILITKIFHFKTIPNRFSISLCIPKILLSIITECWSDIKQWLDLTQSLTILQLEKIVTDNTITNYNVGLLPPDYNSHFPKVVDTIVHDLQRRMIPCFKAFSEIPRLFIYPEIYPEFVNTWFKEVFNWIEIKDGPKLNFLSTLIATILLDVKVFLIENKSTRLVLLSGNPLVANKLVFILANLLEPRFRGSLDLFNKLHPDKNNNNNNNISKPTNQIKEENIEDTVTIDKILTYNNKSHKNKEHNIDKNSLTPTKETDSISNILINSPSSQIFYDSKKGWEIPQKKSSSFRSTSLSSDDSIAEVIQPSSFNSGSSSLRYLSTSISSQPGSYGSWFSKKPSLHRFLSQSPSIKNNDSWERVSIISNPYSLQTCNNNTNINGCINNYYSPYSSNSNSNSNINCTVQRSSSGTSLFQNFNRLYNTGCTSNQTPQPSPSISEYDEYPWFGTTPESPRMESGSLTINNKPLWQNKPLNNINITRDCQKISQSNVIDDAFERICISSSAIYYDNDNDNDNNMLFGGSISKGTDTHAAVLELNYEPPSKRDGFLETLPRYTSYITHFNYWFQIQAISITPDSERHIISAMKKDLHKDLYSNTFYVSLRSREIKKIIMKKDTKSEAEVNLKQRIRMIFNNGKYGHVTTEFMNCIEFVNNSVKKARTLYEDREIDVQTRDNQLVSIFLSILNCNK